MGRYLPLSILSSAPASEVFWPSGESFFAVAYFSLFSQIPVPVVQDFEAVMLVAVLWAAFLLSVPSSSSWELLPLVHEILSTGNMAEGLQRLKLAFSQALSSDPSRAGLL